MSTNLRHVKGDGGRLSGEEIYNICKKRAFDRHGSFVSYDAESEAIGVEKPTMTKESNLKFKILSGLLNTLQKESIHGSSDSASVSTLVSPVSSLLEQTSLLEANPSAGSNMDMDVSYDHIEYVPEPRYYSMFLSLRYPGRSKVVVPAKSEYDVEGLESYQASWSELDDSAVSNPMPEAYMTKDFDTFKNNCRINERSRLNDEGWNDNQKNEKDLVLKRQSDRERNDVDEFGPVSSSSSSSSSAVVQEWEKHASMDKLVEGTLLEAHRTLLLGLAGTSYQSQNQDHLLLQLDAFLQSSKRSIACNKGEGRSCASTDDFYAWFLAPISLLIYFGVS